VRLWKRELQKLTAETRLEISVCHFPPRTSQWNKIEHRLFSFLMKNWRGQPLVSQEVIVNLIAARTTRTDLRVPSQLDTRTYPKGINVGKPEFAAIELRRDAFHGEWNYTIMPVHNATVIFLQSQAFFQLASRLEPGRRAGSGSTFQY
jgi:hypothetical protein